MLVADRRHIRSGSNRCQGKAPRRFTLFCQPFRTHSNYFGRIAESLSRLPGGGITGILPVSGVGARIAGSTPAGGQRTPPDCASRSVNGAPLPCPVVVPFGAIVLSWGTVSVGEQVLAGRAIFAGAVFGPGVDGDGGACANATADPEITHPTVRREKTRMHENVPAARMFPHTMSQLGRFQAFRLIGDQCLR